MAGIHLADSHFYYLRLIWTLFRQVRFQQLYTVLYDKSLWPAARWRGVTFGYLIYYLVLVDHVKTDGLSCIKQHNNNFVSFVDITIKLRTAMLIIDFTVMLHVRLIRVLLKINQSITHRWRWRRCDNDNDVICYRMTSVRVARLRRPTNWQRLTNILSLFPANILNTSYHCL